MHEITALPRISGDIQTMNEIVELHYEELRRLARSRMRHVGPITLLDTTSLVHEAYMHLQRTDGQKLLDRSCFLPYAAKVMRNIIVDAVRTRRAERRGGAAVHLPLNTNIGDSATPDELEVLRVHEALEELASVDERLARIVEMRYFGGITESDIAAALGVTERTVQRDWRKARLFLSAAIK